jgi:hypothetical protein
MLLKYDKTHILNLNISINLLQTPQLWKSIFPLKMQ